MSKLNVVNIKGKDYVMVNTRIIEFRNNPAYQGWSLESEIVSLIDGAITIKASIKDKDNRVIATGLAQEKEASSFINKTSFVENCETSAWGRALGNLGIGIDNSIATAEEVANAIHNQKPESKLEYYDIIKSNLRLSGELLGVENTKIIFQKLFNEDYNENSFREISKNPNLEKISAELINIMKQARSFKKDDILQRDIFIKKYEVKNV